MASSAQVTEGYLSFSDLGAIPFESVLAPTRAYHCRGFRVTSLIGKEPVLKGWHERELAEEEVPHLFFGRRTKAHELVASGEIPSYKIGKIRRLRSPDVEYWLEECKYSPGDRQ